MSRDELPQAMRTRISIAKQIKLIRSAIGMTQAQLGMRLNCKQTVVARIESETSDPNIGTLNRIATALNCELIVFLVPKTKLTQVVHERAEYKARQILQFSTSQAALEAQIPENDVIQDQLELLKQDLMSHKRSRLWED